MSPNVASGGCPAGAVPGASVRFVRIQMPERSGLPSAVRGAGALRFGLPSAPFGTPGFECSAHCADSDAEKAATMAADTTTVNDRFMSPSNECPSTPVPPTATPGDSAPQPAPSGALPGCQPAR